MTDNVDATGSEDRVTDIRPLAAICEHAITEAI